MSIDSKVKIACSDALYKTDKQMTNAGAIEVIGN